MKMQLSVILSREDGEGSACHMRRGFLAPARRPLGMTLAAVALILAACTAKQQKPPDEHVPVAVAVAQQQNLPLSISAIGNVQPLSTVAVRALVGGQLTKVWFREGQDVHRGDMLFTIDPRPFQATLSQAQANLARDEAQLRNAESQANRYADLVKKDYVTKEDYDRITSGAEAARAVVAADRAAIENARLQLAYCEIKSPLDGRTGNLMVHEGNLVRANDTVALVTINQVQPVYVEFRVPEAQLTDVRARLGAAVDAKPQTPNAQTATGKLTFIDNAVDQTTGTIDLKATFPNQDRSLWPGEYVNVSLVLAERPNAIVVPAQAVQTGQRGQYIYVVKQDNGVEMRPVVVAEQLDQQAVIAKGIQAGETVVTDGQLKLTPKSKVEIKARG